MQSFQKTACLCANDQLESRIKEGHKISKQYLVNILNYINFQDRSVLIKFRHKKYNSLRAVQALPQPCLNNRLECLLPGPSTFHQQIHLYELLHMLIDNDQDMIFVKPEFEWMRGNKISLNLPESCYRINFRKAQRYPGYDIGVELIQNSVSFCGKLVDFSSVSFAIRLFHEPFQSFEWINPKSTVTVIFKRGKEVIYSGTCDILRQVVEVESMIIVVAAGTVEISRFQPKTYRSRQQKLVPSPTVVLQHPLTKKINSMKVEGLSCSDLCVEEYLSGASLFVGLIILSMDIEFAPDFKIRCRAQVVKQHFTPLANNDSLIRWDIAFLDMNIREQVQLSNLIHQTVNNKTYVCNRVDLDALWKFFFETGFFYPEKYRYIQLNKEKFKSVYQRLYNHPSEIACHFVFQDKGIIWGHIAMIRFYEKTWLVHHHAARNSIIKKAGLVVLNQIGRYVNDFSRMNSTHMQYLMSYYRTDNNFPNRVFGGFVDYLKNAGGCSIDTFAYCPLPKADIVGGDLEKFLSLHNASLDKANYDDITELNIFYEAISGGLLLDAMDLRPESLNKNQLGLKYEELQFKREKHLFSIKIGGCLKAIIMLTLSDTGLNLSNLTNCFHVIMLDTDELSEKVLISSLHLSLGNQHRDSPTDTPVLIYPESYPRNWYMAHKKSYRVWVFDIRNSDQYFQYMSTLYSGHST